MTSYDDIPYPLVAHSQTHPVRLATLALLHNVQAPSPERCRVLEIGCARGGNLIPMACGLGASDFVGIDLSSRQIAAGQELIQALGLKNIRLEALDLLDFDERFGSFDYIVAHGLYSWVPANVRDRLLEVCQKYLTAAGVAFISFNTYPGWKNLSMVRDLMHYRTRHVLDPMAKASQARELLGSVVETLTTAGQTGSDTGPAHAYFYQEVAETVGQHDLSYVAHEFFEGINQPVYFHEFIEAARQHDLQFLADVNFRQSLDDHLPPKVAQLLSDLSEERIEREQYLDFLANRSFRQVLLCHSGQPIQLSTNFELLQAFQFASPANLDSETAGDASESQTFVGIDGAHHSTTHSVTGLAWQYLIDIWPRSANITDMLTAAYHGWTAQPESEQADADARLIAADLSRAFLISPRLVELAVGELPMALEVSERPVASPWARLQSETDETITTLRHERFRLNALERFVLQRLDGSNTAALIVDQLLAGPLAGRQIDLPDGSPVTDLTETRLTLTQAVGETLQTFYRLPLLVH